MLNLDTHILIHALNDQITKKEDKLLSSHQWCISDVVLLEISLLIKKNRLELDLSEQTFIDLVKQIHIFPIDLAVCKSLFLLDFKSDPADEIISATSLSYGIPLMTRDKKILKSKVVPFA